MTPGRIALLLSPALPLAPLMLALAACGGEQGDAGRKREAPSVPFGFEMAFAGLGERGDAALDTRNAEPAAVIGLAPEELAARLREGGIRLIDVRTDAEVAEGAIPGAEHIPLDRFDPAALDLSDGREVVLYCRSGNRSGVAGEKLAAVTGEPTLHLEGGIIAWEAAGQAIEKR